MLRQLAIFQTATTAAFTFTSRGSTTSVHFLALPAPAAFSSASNLCAGRRVVRGFGRKFSLKQASIQRLHRSTTLSSSIEEMKDSDEWDRVLPFDAHTHNSVKIIVPSSDNGIFDAESFRSRLDATVAACRELQKSAIWVEVPMSRAGLIEKMGEFRFHHADGICANLYLWLKEDVECKIPTYATHQVGVGAIVVNSRDEILCVRELRDNFFRWKIPGGLAELGEQLDDAAIREVLEETGVNCRFRAVLSVRHTHGLQFGRSDLYFVCQLEPIEKAYERTGKHIIPNPVPQEGEIECAAWVPLAKYKEMINAPDGHPMMKHIMQLYDQSRSMEKTVLSSIVPGRKPSPVYHAPLRRDGSLDVANAAPVGEGEHDKTKLLAKMNPILDGTSYVFATTNAPEAYSNIPALMRFNEDEAETLILAEKDAVDAGLEHSEPYKRITLSVHSALNAVGFLSAVCTPLAESGISTNAVAAYFHDHIFVPEEKAGDAMRILEELSHSVPANDDTSR